jgi:hypothetical protein
MKSVKPLLLIPILFACGQGNIKTPDTAMDQFEAFKSKDKFLEDNKLMYPGLAEPSMQPMLSEKMNSAADDFKEVAENGDATAGEYQDNIKKGLSRFRDVYLQLDTEDRGRVCHYFEELMDIVGLESSGGHLNRFMYGFDPSDE